MAQSPIKTAIQQICLEKNLTEEAVLRAIELALAAAYRKDFGNKMQNIIAEFDVNTGGVKVVDVKSVVEDLPEEELEQLNAEVEDEASHTNSAFVVNDDEEGARKFNPRTEIQLTGAKEINKKYKVGDEIVTTLEVPGEFGRMAAQTAKQVIIQKLREVERENVYNEYKELEGQVVNGVIQRREGRNVLVDLERTTAVMPPEEQMMGERYNIGNRMKFYLATVDHTNKGPYLMVSRAHSEIVRKIFETEIPEIANEVIDIKSIAREAGHRSKVAIISNDESIDPIGSCVGQRGARIQTIISELNGEKVDIILWDEDSEVFITNALSPAKVVSVELKENKIKSDSEEKKTEKIATVKVKDDQLSLAIGRAGQNVRLASKLTGWKIDIVSENGEALTKGEKKEDSDNEVVDEEKTEDKVKDKKKVTKKKKAKKDTDTETEATTEKKEKKKKNKVVKKKKVEKREEITEEAEEEPTTEDKTE
jgi:transcription termination/antitermination protein NusA